MDNLTSHIPPHLSESQFRRYEPYLSRALRSWPTSSSFECPEEFAVTTFIGRFRDSVLSVLRFAWPATPGYEIDLILLRDISERKLFTIAADPGTRMVWFRKKERAGAPVVYGTMAGRTSKTETQSSSAIRPPGSVSQKDITDAELCSWLCLVNAGRVEGPILLAGDFTKHPFATQYGNVSLYWDAEKNVTVVT